jgi:signal transduction histidine kinase
LQVTVDELAPDNDRDTAVFRVFQESLTNVARHAQASQVIATISREGVYLVLQIQDNGLGLGAEATQAGRSLGLLGMRERIEAVLGQFEITGAPGKGTMVLIRVPLGEKQLEGAV